MPGCAVVTSIVLLRRGNRLASAAA